LKRVIQRTPQKPIASLVIEGQIEEGGLLPVAAGDGEFIVNGELIEAAA
jgi:hypothetical protein